MKPCCFMHHLAPSPYGGGGSGYAVVFCTTHSWSFDGAPAGTYPSRCPVGQIEDAVETGLGQIAKMIQEIKP